jgi:hypothetical protein
VAQTLLNAVARDLDHTCTEAGVVTSLGGGRFDQKILTIPSDLSWHIEYVNRAALLSGHYYEVLRITSCEGFIDQISTGPSTRFDL